MSGILKLWPPHSIILAPLSRQQSGKAPCWSDLFCHTYLSPHEPGSLIAELCASTVHSQRHQNGNSLLSLLFSSLLGFWPLKLVCLGEFLHVMLLSWLCDYYKYLWVTNVWWSSESFSPWEWAMCAVHSQAPIRGLHSRMGLIAWVWRFTCACKYTAPWLNRLWDLSGRTL